MTFDMTINQTIEEKGEVWMIAAMMHGSIGYHTPNHAKRILLSYKEGRVKDYCERCDACFNNDLLAMMNYDISLFKRYESIDPDRANLVIQFAEKAIKLSEEVQSSISMAYPTMGGL